MSDTALVPGPDTMRAFRNALGAFGTGVTVVTVRDADGPLAMTANSFSSVSLDPPLVLWCPALNSHRYAPFVEAERFAIHVLASDQAGLADHFARDGRDFGPVTLASTDDDSPPAFEEALARFDCRRRAVHEGGDHSIVVGEVLGFLSREGKGLLFGRGGYGWMAPPL